MKRGELIAWRYELIKRLGRGGMGEVWAGRDRMLRRHVAHGGSRKEKWG